MEEIDGMREEGVRLEKVLEDEGYGQREVTRGARCERLEEGGRYDQAAESL